MSQFPEAWLRLREPFDHRARSAAMVEALVPELPERRPLRVVELGAGLGSGMRYLAPRIGVAQHWTLVDHDPRLLGAVGAAPEGVVAVEPHRLDLRALDALELDADLVSTQALLDLVSRPWLASLAEWVVARSVPILAALTVDGRVRWFPEDSRDDEVQAAFRAHQITDRGFGASPGPEAAAVLAELLEGEGMRVQLAASDWQIGADSTEMLRQMVMGTAQAAAEAAAGLTSESVVAAWTADRLAAIEAGGLSLLVGHQDLLALP